MVVNRDGEAALVELKQLSMDVSLDGEHNAVAAQAYKHGMWSLDHRIGVIGEVLCSKPSNRESGY